MIIPNSYEELASYVDEKKSVFFFTADWCGDCRVIQPIMPEIEAAFPTFRFIEVDRDRFIDLTTNWGIFGIPSFVVTEEGQELGRLVNKKRKTKAEIIAFLTTVSSNK